MSQSRQLAAIMFTDIVGYTALMGEDEQKAFELLDTNRKLQRPIIEKYHGKWLKEMGDGVLASFSTVSDAVYCAGAIQQACKNEPNLKLRIGIHEGEVVFRGSDVFGDGVNLASRLEPLAPIGGILVSESVNRNLGNKKGIETIFVGEETLKNIIDPIKVYQVKVAVAEAPEPETSADASPRQIEPSGQKRSAQKKILLGVSLIILLLLGYIFYNNIFSKGQTTENATEQELMEKSIAVLPFSTITKDSSSRYIAEGVREAILNSLFKIDELQVGSRTSAETYRNSPKKIPEIASELGVATVLEGSAQKFGDQIRITVQLIDGKTDNHLWSEEYDRDWGDIFVIYTEIAEKVAAALQVVITPEEKQQIATMPTTNATAYDYILQARDEQWKYWGGGDTIALKKAEMLYNKVLKLDPEYALGWVHKGSIYWDRHGSTIDYFEKNFLDSVLWYCDKAIALNPNEVHAYFLKGMVFHQEGNIDLAIKNYQQALVLGQNDAAAMWEASWRLGYIYLFKKDYIKGIGLIRNAVQSAKGSPRDYRHMLSRLGAAYMFIGAYEQAENYPEVGCFTRGNFDIYDGNFQASIDRMLTCCIPGSNDSDCYYLLANAYLQLREFETSVKYFQKFREKLEESNNVHWSNLYREGFALTQMGYQEEGMKLIEEQLTQLEIRKKLKRSDGYDYHLAAIYASRGDQERALQHLRDYQESIIFLPPNKNLIPIRFSQYDIMFENLWDNEEFKAIVKRDQQEKAAIIAQIKEMEERGELDL